MPRICVPSPCSQPGSLLQHLFQVALVVQPKSEVLTFLVSPRLSPVALEGQDFAGNPIGAFGLPRVSLPFLMFSFCRRMSNFYWGSAFVCKASIVSVCKSKMKIWGKPQSSLFVLCNRAASCPHSGEDAPRKAGPGSRGSWLRSGCLGKKESEPETDWKNRLELRRVRKPRGRAGVTGRGGVIQRRGKSAWIEWQHHSGP